MRRMEYARSEYMGQRWLFSTASFVWCFVVFFATVVCGYASVLPLIQDVRFRSAADETRVVIEINRVVQYQVGHLAHPKRLYIDLPKTQLARDWERHSVEIDDERVQTIRIVQSEPQQVRIVLDLKVLGDFRVYTLPSPYRVVVDLRGKVTASRNGAPSPGTGRPVARQPSTTTSSRPIIVIDPGHGGKDPGAVSHSGLEEKTVVLEIAKELRSLLHETLPQYDVMLTRESDVFIPLSERAKIANQQQARLFISLHVNASPRRHVHGIETWYLSFAANARAKQIAARENQMSEAQLSDLEIILRDLHETDRINQSASLASTMQSMLTKHMALRYRSITDRGIDGAPFVVLMHTTMPSVLVEVAFISNDQDAYRLRSQSYRRELAQGVLRGIQHFLQTSVARSR